MDASRKSAMLMVEFVTILVLMSALGSKSQNCSLKREARTWMDSTDLEFGRRLNQKTLLIWDIYTNFTTEVMTEYARIEGEYYYWMKNESAKAAEFLEQENNICNSTVTRMLRLFKLDSLAKNLEALRAVRQLRDQISRTYRSANVTRNGTVYRLEPELAYIMKTNRSHSELLWAWRAYHDTARRMKTSFAEFIRNWNALARDNGYSDIGTYRNMRDFDEALNETVMDQLLEGLMPFYKQLHAYARKRLATHYQGINNRGFIPAHLLGDMWAKQWHNIEDILLPFPDAQPTYNVTRAMLDQGYTPTQIYRVSEAFLVSLGLDPMTSDFWNKSILFGGRSCAILALNSFTQTDFRINMCTAVTHEDLLTVHQAMGVLENYMLYRHQPNIFRFGANSALMEALGGSIRLSVMTDKHLAAINLIPSSVQSQEQEINSLMRTALRIIPSIPFLYVIYKWQNMVSRGEITPGNYTSSWWNLREQYNGIKSPVVRSNNDFDPGSTYYVAINEPISRELLSNVGYFQIYSELCKEANHNGSLHKCDFYRSQAAGRKLRSALKLGRSKPWHEVMEMLTGQRRFKMEPLVTYFQPLIDWLQTNNTGEYIGWNLRSAI